MLPASVTIRRDETERKFPITASNRSNPLDRGTVEIAVHSEFYEAWGRYFETLTESDVTLDHTNNTARIELVIPFDEDFEQVLATTDPHGITANPGPPPSPHQMGIGYPDADSLIEERIEECETNASACEASPPYPLTNGTYYYNTSLTGDVDINTSEGDVAIVVNGSFTPGTVNVTGPHNVTVYVNGDFAFGGIDTINYGGDAVAFTAIVHSTGDVDMNGAFRYVGFVYAPGSDVDLNGGGPPWFVNVRGGIVGKTIDINGHPNKFEYDASISDIEIDTETGLSTITYLHVSRTTINVTGPT